MIPAEIPDEAEWVGFIGGTFMRYIDLHSSGKNTNASWESVNISREGATVL